MVHYELRNGDLVTNLNEARQRYSKGAEVCFVKVGPGRFRAYNSNREGHFIGLYGKRKVFVLEGRA